jgi:hypothetical protein
MDEFELEVADLRPGGHSREGSPVEAGGATEAGVGVPVAARRSPCAGAASRLTPALQLRRWRRWVGGVVATGTLLLALAVIFGSMVDPGAAISALLRSPTPAPTATLPLGDDLFVVENAVPWGVLLADRRPVRTEDTNFQPPSQIALPVPVFGLSRGRHTIEYRAAPFPTLRCQVSVPAARDDSCPLFDPGPVSPLPGLVGARLLDLGARLERLPPDQLVTLIQVANAVLNSPPPSTAVLPGERYLAADGSAAVAGGPLEATLVVAVNQDPQRFAAAGAGGSCVSLCAVDAPPDTVPTDAWPIVAHLVLSWSYVTLGGAVVAASAPATDLTDVDPSLWLAVRWDDRWEVTPGASPGRPTSTLCLLAQSVALAGGPPYYPKRARPITPQAPLSPADGCLIVAPLFGSNGLPLAQPAYLLYRLGLLLAANAPARTSFPRLPAATANEQALAQQIAAQPYPRHSSGP